MTAPRTTASQGKAITDETQANQCAVPRDPKAHRTLLYPLPAQGQLRMIDGAS